MKKSRVKMRPFSSTHGACTEFTVIVSFHFAIKAKIVTRIMVMFDSTYVFFFLHENITNNSENKADCWTFVIPDQSWNYGYI